MQKDIATLRNRLVLLRYRASLIGLRQGLASVSISQNQGFMAGQKRLPMVGFDCRVLLCGGSA